MLEPRSSVTLDLGSLWKGGDGLRREQRWVALAAHLDQEIYLNEDQCLALGKIPSDDWVEAADLEVADTVLAHLLECGLCLEEQESGLDLGAADDAIRASHWWPLGAVAHRHSRWEGLDSVAAMEASGLVTAASMRARLGMPPPEVAARATADARLPLPRRDDDVLDQHWQRRATCRNFAADVALPREALGLMLQRVLMANAQLPADEGLVFLKKNVPSGGGLHPTAAYLLVQRVEGISSGFYHYHPVDHALEPLATPACDSLPTLSRKLLAGQYWFSDAPVLVFLVARFSRSFWKYRNHAKGYRALLLDAGHISQALYLSALDLGLGAFVTAAVNEVDIERVLGLDPLREGVLAVCGFGARAHEQSSAELDPLGRVWKSEDA